MAILLANRSDVVSPARRLLPMRQLWILLIKIPRDFLAMSEPLLPVFVVAWVTWSEPLELVQCSGLASLDRQPPMYATLRRSKRFWLYGFMWNGLSASRAFGGKCKHGSVYCIGGMRVSRGTGGTG
ncbi:MAG: hypothetical protein KDB27_21625 [Planctomycetales bacterium]|nr:hypothetical protein [Planctomycetales bacterium]